MKKEATFDSSFWVHTVYLNLVDYLIDDYALIVTEEVIKELGENNPSGMKLDTLLREKRIKTCQPTKATVTLYGEGGRAAINLALEKHYLLFIDDWRPAEAARIAGIEVVNSITYAVFLYEQGRLSAEQTLDVFAFMARRGTLKPEYLVNALKLLAEVRYKKTKKLQ